MSEMGDDLSLAPDTQLSAPRVEQSLDLMVQVTAHAHQSLDAAVAAAYGWADDTSEMPAAEILRRLLALNLERAG